MNSFKALFEARQDVAEVNRIIQRFVTDTAPYDDIVLRVAGFTGRFRKPDTNKSESIDIIPVLDALTKAGYVRKRSDGMYTRSDAVSRVISDLNNKKLDTRLARETDTGGRLTTTTAARMAYMSDTDGKTAGEVLDSAPRTYKAGGKYSGPVREFIIKTIKENDPAYAAMPDSAKEMITTLRNLSQPKNAFKLLRDFLAKRNARQGYASFVKYVTSAYGDKAYVDALAGLDNAGIVVSERGTINLRAVEDIRTVMNYFAGESFDNIEPVDKVGAFLPNFIGTATADSAAPARNIKMFLTEPKFASVIDRINRGLTDDYFATTMSKEPNELPSIADKVIHRLATYVDADSPDDLRTKVQNLRGRQDDATKAKGRTDSLFKTFSI